MSGAKLGYKPVDYTEQWIKDSIQKLAYGANTEDAKEYILGQLFGYIEDCERHKRLTIKYAKHLAKKYPEYHKQQFEGKNGADSDNEKGYWRGMADSVLAILTDWKHHGLIAHTGLYGDDWPKEEGKEV
jgi:hypothetical protein